MPEQTKTNKIIGDNILRLRSDKKMTQDDLAKKIGIRCKGGGALISRMEAGINGDPSLKKLRALANALDCSVSQLLAKYTPAAAAV